MARSISKVALIILISLCSLCFGQTPPTSYQVTATPSPSTSTLSLQPPFPSGLYTFEYWITGIYPQGEGSLSAGLVVKYTSHQIYICWTPQSGVIGYNLYRTNGFNPGANTLVQGSPFPASQTCLYDNSLPNVNGPAPSSIYLPQTYVFASGASKGAWANVQGGIIDSGEHVFDVRAYGAKCDGKTDDTQAINAALYAASLGGIVFIPRGTCNFSSGLTVGPISIRGAGYNASILNYTPSTGTAITFSYTSPNFQSSPGLSDLTLLGASTIDGTVGVVAGSSTGATGLNVRRVLISGFGTGLENAESSFMLDVSNSHFIDGVDVNLSAPSGSGENMRFEHCIFDHNSVVSSVVFGGGDTLQVTLLDNSFDGAMLEVNWGMVNGRGDHFEDTISGGTYFGIIGDGTHDANVSLTDISSNDDGNYTFPSASYFHVLGGSSLSLTNYDLCSTKTPFNVINGDSGATSYLTNLIVPNCGGYANHPTPITGSGSFTITSTPNAHGNIFNYLTQPIQFGSSGPSISFASGTPSGACVTGSVYMNTSGASGSSLYACVASAWTDIK